MVSSNLTSLANKYRSDKGTQFGDPPHRYSTLYDFVLDKYRDREILFLELGLAQGGPEVEGGSVDRRVASPSVSMWLEYFPSAKVAGFDISDFSHISDPRFVFVRGDAGVESDLDRLAAEVKAADVIIDDGSHASFHQQLAFKKLWPLLKPNGTYIIEDLHWQSPMYEDKLPKVPLTRDFFIKYFEEGHYIDNSTLSEEFVRNAKASLRLFSWFPPFESNNTNVPKLLVMCKG